jgi:hypothetical protein
MNDRPTTFVRGLIAVAVAVALNIGLFLGFDAMGIGLRVFTGPDAADLADMSLIAVLINTTVPGLVAILFAMILNRFTGKARVIFSSVVVLVAFLSLLALLPLDNSTIDRVFQGVMHLVPAATLVALVSPTLRSE